MGSPPVSSRAIQRVCPDSPLARVVPASRDAGSCIQWWHHSPGTPSPSPDAASQTVSEPALGTGSKSVASDNRRIRVSSPPPSRHARGVALHSGLCLPQSERARTCWEFPADHRLALSASACSQADRSSGPAGTVRSASTCTRHEGMIRVSCAKHPDSAESLRVNPMQSIPRPRFGIFLGQPLGIWSSSGPYEAFG